MARWGVGQSSVSYLFLAGVVLDDRHGPGRVVAGEELFPERRCRRCAKVDEPAQAVELGLGDAELPVDVALALDDEPEASLLGALRGVGHPWGEAEDVVLVDADDLALALDGGSSMLPLTIQKNSLPGSSGSRCSARPRT